MAKHRVSVSERAITGMTDPRYLKRLQDPFGQPSEPIGLKDPSRIPRWFNAAIISDKIWRAKNQGWDGVRLEDIVDQNQLGAYSISPDGFVTRGDHGREVLMSMPKDVYRAIQQAKTARNLRNVRDPEREGKEVVQAVGDRYGDEAAKFVHGAVKDSIERLERADEA